MSSLTQDQDHQSSDVILSICWYDKFDIGKQGGIKSTGTVDSA